MSLRCNLGIHNWARWREYTEVIHHQVRSVIGHRMPQEDYETSRPMQKRECRRCGLVERRAV